MVFNQKFSAFPTHLPYNDNLILERRSLHKADSGAISSRAMLCSRRAKLEPPKLEFRAVAETLAHDL